MLYKGKLRLKGALLEGENPLPYFSASNPHKQVKCDDSFPEYLKKQHGHYTNFSILPYNMQDRYSREKEDIELDTIVLENNKLKATFIMGLGGRLWSLEDKETGRELLSKNPVFQPANLANRNAWFSGGIEWNIGYVGHAFHTCSPVFAAKVEHDGETFLRIYEYERKRSVFWQIDFHLPENSDTLRAHVKIINYNDYDLNMYWWTNIAVPQTQKSRVFCGDDNVIFISFDKATESKFGFGKMPELPSLPGKDFSYPVAPQFSSEYFFQCEDNNSYYEAVAYENGTAFYDISTNPLKYRKMFCWGTHAGGNHWQEYLSDENTEYFEIQAGLAPSQLHGITMPKDTVWEFTQCFGSVDIDCDKAYDESWYTSRDYIESTIYSQLSETELFDIDKKYKKLAHVTPTEILTKADGWGALEIKRLAAKGISVTSSMIFDDSTLSNKQLPWIELLDGNGMSERSGEQFVASWMIQKEWFELLKASIDTGRKSWNALLHLGIMYYEQNEHEKAVCAWNESYDLSPNVWVMRNLAVAYKESGETDKVYESMDKLWKMQEAKSDQAFGLEYLNALVEIKDYKKAWQVFNSLPYHFQKDERIEIVAGKVAMELGNLDFVRDLFKKDYAIIREGENTITDLWFRYHAKIKADELGISVTDELLEEVIKECPPPQNIDFRQSL